MRLVISPILAATGLVLVVLAAPASEEHDRRAKMPNTEARRIAGELFPEQCGNSGDRCGIIYGPEFCALQFAITFPRSTDLPDGGAVAWVTVDPRGKVVEVSFSRSKECRNGNGIAS